MNKTERNPENAFFFEQNKKSSGKAEGFFMVETAGLEPVTSTMRMSRSPR